MRGIIYAVLVSLISTFVIGAHTSYASMTVSDATPIPLNQHITGTISDTDQKDIYKVSLPSDGNLHVAMTNVSSGSWHMMVLDQEGNQLDDVTTDKLATGDSEVQVGLAQGDYYIEVENSSNSTGVTYDLSTNFESSPYFEKENNDSLATANPISFNQPYKGNLSSDNDTDFYKVVVENDGNLTLSIDQQPSVSWSGVIMDSKGKELEWIYPDPGKLFSGYDDVTHVGVAKGTYYIKIYFGSPGCINNPYTFTVGFENSDYYEKEFNDSIQSANPISVNKTYNGTINYYLDEDYYKFTLPADGNVTLSVTQKPGASWYAAILNAKGEVYTENHTDSGQPADEYLDQTVGLPKGTYYIQIGHNGAGIDVPYSFSVKYQAGPYYEKEFNNTLATANSMLLNQSYVGILQNGRDKDYYKFTVNQTGYVQLMMKNQTVGTWKTSLQNATGSLNKSFITGYGKGYTVMKTYLQKGTYYIKVDYNSNSYTFPYELKVIQYSNPLAATQITVKNNKNKADSILVSKIGKGDVIKVYNSKKQLITSTTSKGTSVTATAKQLGAAAGTIYVSITHPGMLESNYTAKKFSKE